MKVKFLAGAIVLAVILAAIPNVTAGTITITEVSVTPSPPKPGDTFHLKAKVNATVGVQKVVAYPCFEKPSYTCSNPERLYDANADGFWEGNLPNVTIVLDNTYHINITVTDKDSIEKMYVIPPFKVTAGTGQPSNYTTQSDCEAVNYHWWDDECHAKAKELTDFKDKASCELAGHYWYDSKCNADKGTPEKYTDKTSCTNVSYFWYDNKCNLKKQDPGKGFIPGFEGILVFVALGSAGLVMLGSRRKKN
jgi:hypothetical protein